MPLFDFECRDCQATFEELVKSPDDTASVRCSSCGSAKVERLLSVFSARSTSPSTRGGAGLPGPSRRGKPPAGGCGSGCGCHRGWRRGPPERPA